MSFALRVKLLTCLMVYVSGVHSIKVTFGTKGGPILPPVTEPPQPPSQPFRTPAPVWEERYDDAPDPNAHWRPQLFIPQPRYTQVIFNAPQPTQESLNNAQRFVNSYKPVYKTINRHPVRQFFNPSQVLSSQSLPGIGIRYFVPAYVNDLYARKEEKKQDDAKHNDIETNDIEHNNDSSNDVLWQFEKESSKRTLRNTLEGSARANYPWPAHVQTRH